MSTPEAKIVIGIDLLLRRLGPTLKGLDAVEKKLRSVAGIKIASKSVPTAQFDKAAAATQKLHQQQQRLAIQIQELVNRQERARQAAERLTQSQQRLAQSSDRLLAAQRRLSSSPPRADAHVRFFKETQKAALDADKHVRFFRSNQASLAKAPQVDAHVRAFKAIQKGAEDADKHVQFFRANERALQKAPQLDAHVKAFRATEEATRRARAESERLERQKLRLARSSDTLEKALGRMGGTLNRIGSGLQSFGRTLSVAVTAPLAALGLVAVGSAKDIDANVNTLKAFTGSAEAAETRLAELIQTSRETPGLTTSLGLLLDSNLRVAQVTVDTIDKVLPAIGRLNAVKPLEDPARFVQNMVQLVTQNFERIDLKELVGQSPVAGQIVAELFNVDSPINAKAIRAAAQKMGLTTTDAFFTAFADAAARNQALSNVTESIGSRLAKQADRLAIALRPLGLAILDAITPAINVLIPFVERLSRAFAELPKPAQQALLVIGALAALLGPALIVIGGIATAVGGLVTAIGAVAGVVATIGLPAIAAAIGGIVIIIGEWVAILAALGLAWKTNFLGIRELVTRASTAILQAFQRVRAIVEEVIQRILPTLQSITTKVLGLVTAAWEKYGKDVVAVVKATFTFVTRVVETFVSIFGNVVDLLLKLIDGDFKGAWAAFARIVLTAVKAFDDAINNLPGILIRAFIKVRKIINDQAVKFAAAGATLAFRLVIGIITELINSAPKVRDAIVDMFLLAAQGFDPASIAGIIVARFIAALRRAAAGDIRVSVTGEGPGPHVGADVGGDAFKKGVRRPASAPDEDKHAAGALRRAQDDFAQAQNEFTQTQEENRLAETRAGIQQQFELTKDGLDRELRLLQSSFDDRFIEVKKYFDERKRLEEAQIDTELKQEKALSVALVDEFGIRRKAIEREFQAAVDEINRDPKLKGRAKELSLQTAEINKQKDLAKAQNDFETQLADVSTRILVLQKKRADIGTVIARETANLTRELREQADVLTADVFEAQGATSDAAAIRLRQQFKDSLRDLRVDVKSLAPELQTALNNVDLKTLKTRLEELPQPVRDLIALLDIAFNRALITEQSVKVDRTLSELRIREADVQNKVLDGVINERQARAQIAGLQQISKARLLDILAAQLKIAESTAGQEDEVLRLRTQIQEIERLGKVIDDVGQQINQQLFSDIESGLEGIFQNARKGFDGLKDAAISFGESLLNTLNKIAAQSITQKLEGIFKPDAENTKGTVGGFFAKLFGLGPKAADTTAATALATAGTTAGTALTTGGTAAATALTAGSTTASASLITGVTTAAASFAATVTAAAAAFAATVAGAQSLGGLGGAFAAAKGDIFSPVEGGRLGVIAEGGYSEAVLTTDPKHAARQFAILQAYLRETKGLFGRIPHFASGAFISARDTEMSLLSSIQRAPSPLSMVPDAALAHAAGGREWKQRFVFVDERSMRDWINSPEGEEVIVQKIIKNAPVIRRLAGGRR